MCGIAGWLGPLVNSDDYAFRVAKALNHRGPDAQGVQRWHQATLVHTRLSIIDLSPAGKQPIANEDKTIWTVFNGEIYNHKDLRRNLEAKGHKFVGRSDAEILPHLYEEFGLSFLEKLRGMFAIAVYDVRTGTLALARDRFGIKPLFYAPGSKRLGFASEINALRQLPDIDDRIDRQAVSDFTALLYIPAPETFWVGVRALRPGEILEAQLDGHEIQWKTRFYHKWTISPDPSLSLSQATDRADILLAAATNRQLESDVPLGSLLSGGIDSSLVSAAAQRGLETGLQTFNVKFSEKLYDETWAALAVSKHIGSQHQVLYMNGGLGTWEKVTNLLRHAGQPFADTSIFPVNAVCQLMRKHVTVALSGDGGDEGFGGYNFYWQIARIAMFQRLPSVFWKFAAQILFPLTRLGIVKSYVPRRLRELSDADDITIMQSMFCWIREEEHRKLCKDRTLLPIRRFFEPQWENNFTTGIPRIERLSAHATEVNVRLTLPNDFLFKVDLASMKEGLEVRVPMLDEELFAFGLTLPHHLKVKGRTCKRVLRSVAERQLPISIAEKPKRGFGIPIDVWVNADFKTRLREELLGPRSKLPEFYKPSVYRPLVEAFCATQPYHGLSRQGLYQRNIMFLSLQLALSEPIK